jgi:hypothetical protein
VSCPQAPVIELPITWTHSINYFNGWSTLGIWSLYNQRNHHILIVITNASISFQKWPTLQDLARATLEVYIMMIIIVLCNVIPVTRQFEIFIFALLSDIVSINRLTDTQNYQTHHDVTDKTITSDLKVPMYHSSSYPTWWFTSDNVCIDFHNCLYSAKWICIKMVVFMR